MIEVLKYRYVSNSLNVTINFFIHATSVRFEMGDNQTATVNRVEYDRISGWLYLRQDGTWGRKQEKSPYNDDYYDKGKEIYITRIGRKDPTYQQEEKLFTIISEEWQKIIESFPGFLNIAAKNDKLDEIDRKLADIEKKKQELADLESELAKLQSELEQLKEASC